MSQQSYHPCDQVYSCRGASNRVLSYLIMNRPCLKTLLPIRASTDLKFALPICDDKINAPPPSSKDQGSSLIELILCQASKLLFAEYQRRVLGARERSKENDKRKALNFTRRGVSRTDRVHV